MGINRLSFKHRKYVRKFTEKSSLKKQQIIGKNKGTLTKSQVFKFLLDKLERLKFKGAIPPCFSIQALDYTHKKGKYKRNK
jgi:predicted nucleic acid-binding Zn finger protein